MSRRVIKWKRRWRNNKTSAGQVSFHTSHCLGEIFDVGDDHQWPRGKVINAFLHLDGLALLFLQTSYDHVHGPRIEIRTVAFYATVWGCQEFWSDFLPDYAPFLELQMAHLTSRMNNKTTVLSIETLKYKWYSEKNAHGWTYVNNCCLP